MTDEHPLSELEFRKIYSKVPRLTVEIIIRSDKGTFLTQRSIEPCKNMWHLPGGTVRYGERLTDAVSRIAKREVGIEIKGTELLGYIEYPSHYEKGLDSPVGIAFEVTKFRGQPQHNAEAKNSGWFNKLPDNMHLEQQDFLRRTVL